MSKTPLSLFCAMALFLAACDDEDEPPPRDAAPKLDSSSVDTAPPKDTAPAPDTVGAETGAGGMGGTDGGPSPDTGPIDGPEADAPPPEDMAPVDAPPVDMAPADAPPPDLAPDLPPDLAPDLPPDLAPDLAPDTPAAVTWTNDIMPIFAMKCAPCHTILTSGGHNLGASYAAAMSAVMNMGACGSATTKGACTIVRIQNGTMPMGKGCTGDPAMDSGDADCLTAAEQAKVQAWVTAGLPQ